MQAGLTPREIDRTTLREWMLLMQGRRREERSEWHRTLAVVNTIGGIMGADPVTIDELQESGDKGGDREAYEALKGRHIDWITNGS